MLKKIKKVAIYYLAVVSGLMLILGGINWYLAKQDLVRLGLAKPNFPYVKYSQAELDKMYPQYPLENIKTTQTPEETYAKFIAALKRGDLEDASTYFFARDSENYSIDYRIDEKKQKKWLDFLQEVKNEGLLEKMIKDLDQKIEKVSMYDTIAQYSVDVDKEGKKWAHNISFIKDIDGVWRIESL